jgi:hypothetical protein
MVRVCRWFSGLDAFEMFWHDAGAGLGKGTIPMRSDTPRLPVVLAALVGGIALFVAGFIIAAEMRSAAASPAAAVTASGCYTNWNADTCSTGYTAVETGLWTPISQGGTGTGIICAAEKSQNSTAQTFDASTRNGPTSHRIHLEPCAVCCAVVTLSVGGIGELSTMAGMGGSPGYNYAVAGVLALVAVTAFAAGGWYARRRWVS